MPSPQQPVTQGAGVGAGLTASLEIQKAGTGAKKEQVGHLPKPTY
jgi:hypothetical protein